MKRVVIILIVLIAVEARAAQHPNLAKGFQPDSVYQVNGIDNINAFNGNLTLTIPVGPAFNIGGGLSYQLRLYSNVNFWDAEERVDLDLLSPQPCLNPEITPCMHAFPNRRANAGLGWLLSLGRLIPPSTDWQSTNDGTWTYESPDGAEHEFKASSLGPNPAVADTWYDPQSYLRLRKVGSRYAVDFPNGEVHTFMSTDDPSTSDDDAEADYAPWVLESITNQFAGNRLTITYVRSTPGGPFTQWILDDGYRQQIVDLEAFPFESGVLGTTTLDNQRMLVTRIRLAAFGNVVGTYLLTYGPPPLLNGVPGLPRPDWHNINTAYVPRYATVQVLKQLTLPDGTRYGIDYTTEALPERLTLPTGGKIEWTWGRYSFPYVAADSREYLRFADGVTVRKVFDRGSSTPTGTWTYSPASAGERALVTTIQDPRGGRSKQYFNAYALPFTDPPAPPPDDYSKPFTSHQSLSRGGVTLYLSDEFIPAGEAASVRASWVRFDDTYQTVVASRKVYEDGAFLDTDSALPDGYGHYRQVTTSGTGLQPRTTTTNYRGLAIASAQPWLTSLFDRMETREAGRSLVSEFYFATTGFLERKRLVKDTLTGARSPKDVIVAYTPDARGNVIREDYHGGDTGTLDPNQALASVTLASSPVYRIVHEYDAPNAPSYGTVRSSVYEQAGKPSVSILSQDIDSAGLVREARDPSGLPTTYEYDVMGRPTWVRPAGRAATKYTYPDFATSSEIVVEQFPYGATTGSLSEAKYLIDGLGRVTRETIRTGASAYSKRETTYDPMGWQSRVSELGDVNAATLPETTFGYDAFGRVLSVTAPDNSSTGFTYQGIRGKTRTYSVSSAPGSATQASVVESYDLLGRLIGISEPAGRTNASTPTGQPVITTYAYGPGGQLSSVHMSGPDGAQDRLFDYDGRGFLLWESHPEAGTTSYTYDPRGHVLTREQSGAQSQFDLKYTYDHAERLTKVEARNPLSGTLGQPEWRPMKTFTYGYDNLTNPVDYRKGKLLTAARYNYPSWDIYDDDTYRVTETYQYRDSAGRKTNRLTSIARFYGVDDSSATTYREVNTGMTYDDLDEAVTVDYPKCVGCAIPAHQIQSFAYSNGLLKSAAGFVSDITYHPNLMWHVISHTNGVNDTQELGPDGMARPYLIKAATWNHCPLPKIVAQPVGGRITATKPSVTLSIGLSQDSGIVSYVWTNVDTGAVVSTSATYTAQPATTTRYEVRVSNECHEVTSDVAVVYVGECVLPGGDALTTSITHNPDGTYTLTASNAGTQPISYQWVRSADNVAMGSERSITITAAGASATYSVTATNECGTRTASTTIAPPLTVSSTGFDATWTGSAIQVTWTASAGAIQYGVERRSGTEWVSVATPTGTSYLDTAVTNGRTYAYRIRAGDGTSTGWSPYSSAAVATTRSFAQAVPQSLVSAVSVDTLLQAVNSVRAAAGWPAVTWRDILPTWDASPTVNVTILASHIVTCRARMNEALQALGVPAAGYGDGNLSGTVFKAEHINEILRRAQ